MLACQAPRAAQRADAARLAKESGVCMKTQRTVILGAGMVGSAMAADLVQDEHFSVTVADRDAGALERLQQRLGGPQGHGPRVVRADLGDPAAVTRLASEHDLVLGALSSVIGLQTLRAVIEAGRPYVDISFMPEDALSLSGLAAERGVTAVVDCGVAPGMSNMICGYAAARLQPCESLAIYVGGLPVERRWPFEYKAGFAPLDVIEEYVRPSRLVEDGRVVVREALSEPELLDFPGIGTLEVFNTDGLRSLAATLSVPFMKEKTLRYPGHIALMRVLRETGLFSKEPVEVPVAGGGAGGSGSGGTVRVRPLDVTARMMFPKWTYAPGEADLTVMRVSAEGRLDATPNGGRVRLQWDLLDYHDPETDTRSMSRTTGFPATIMARFLVEGRFRKPGVHPPETVGAQPGLLDAMLQELQRRGVKYTASVTELPAQR
jgi:saccharopine dehydrogenase-like NADP-dependent oxidoreductase